MKKGDRVEAPAHYTWIPGGVEPIQIAEHLSFCAGNVVKYVVRAGRKSPSPLEDLRKAEWYLKREIARLEAEAKGTP